MSESSSKSSLNPNHFHTIVFSDEVVRRKWRPFGQRYTLLSHSLFEKDGEWFVKVRDKYGRTRNFPTSKLVPVMPMTPQRLQAIIIGSLIGAIIGYFSAQLVIGFLR